MSRRRRPTDDDTYKSVDDINDENEEFDEDEDEKEETPPVRRLTSSEKETSKKAEEPDQLEDEEIPTPRRLLRMGLFFLIPILIITMFMSMCRSCMAPADIGYEMRLDSLEQASKAIDSVKIESITPPVVKPEPAIWVLMTDGQRTTAFSYSNGVVKQKINDVVGVVNGAIPTISEQGELLSVAIGEVQYFNTSLVSEESLPKEEPPCRWEWYTIEPGDDLGYLAEFYGFSHWRELATFMDNESRIGYGGRIVAGRKIKVPCLKSRGNSSKN